MIRIRTKTARSGDLDMTPLLDVIFILLLFFVVAASFTVRGLEVELPKAQATAALSGRVVEIRLSEDGAFFIEDVPVAREDVPYKLHEVVRSFHARPGQLVLLAAPKAPVEALVYLVDEVRRCGGEKLMVAAAPSEEHSP